MRSIQMLCELNMLSSNLNRKMILALSLGGIAGVLILVFAINGLSKTEVIIETRLSIFCFDGLFKIVFCSLLILYVPSLAYVIHLGNRITSSSNCDIGLTKKHQIFLVSIFFGSMISIVISLFIASGSCN